MRIGVGGRMPGVDISFSTASKVYETADRNIVALRDVTFSAQPGEVIAFVGPSGCGKTTLLKVAAGLEEPTGGSVRVAGELASEFLKAGRTGMVFQRPVLFGWRTVKGNLLLPFELASECSEPSENRILASLTEVGLLDCADSMPHELSGGMIQRAAFALAGIRSPDLLLVDEGFSAVDELAREKLWEKMARTWADRGTTVLLVTHSVREAVFLGDRVFTMSARNHSIVNKSIEVDQRNPRSLDFLMSEEFLGLSELVRQRLG